MISRSRINRNIRTSLPLHYNKLQRALSQAVSAQQTASLAVCGPAQPGTKRRFNNIIKLVGI